MRLRKTTPGDLPQLKALWALGFGDTEQEIEAFFAISYPTATGFCAEEDGKVIAAAYAALAWISNFFGLAFPAIQFRLSEALCVLPCRDRKAAIPGLAVGCLITNLLSPYGLLDLVVGTLATLLAAVWSGRCRSAWTAAVPPVVCNMVLVGAMLAWESTGFSAAFAGLFAYNALTVGIGEAAVCFLLGVPLLRALEKRAIA